MKHNFLKLIFNNSIFISIFYFVLILPRSITLFPKLDNFFDILSLLMYMFIIVVYILNKKYSKIQLYLFLFFFSLFIPTLFKSHDYMFYIKLYINYFSVSLFTELSIKYNFEVFYKGFKRVLSIFIIFNFVSLFLFPNGIMNIKEYYFLGYDNASIITIVIGTTILCALDTIKNGKLSKFTVFLVFISFLTYYLQWAVSCMVNIVLLILYIILLNNDKFLFIKKRITIKKITYLSLIIFLSLVFFRIQNIFEFLIVDILHKDLTITGRIYIWDRCIYYIRCNPIIGMGVYDYSTRTNLYNIYHAHSTYLHILLEGGIVSLLAYLNIFFKLNKQINKLNFVDNKGLFILIFGIFSYFFSTLVDVIHNSQMIYILFNLIFFYSIIRKDENYENFSN